MTDHPTPHALPASWVERARMAPIARRTGDRAVHWLAGIAALGGTWAVVEGRQGRLPRWEAPAFAAVNRLPDSLRPMVWPVMQAGNFWVWAAAAPVGYALGRRWQPPAAWTGSVVLAWAAAKAVKEVVRRGRPLEFLPGTIIREQGITGMGFVSGHSAIAFALSTAMWPYLPRGWRGAPFVVASSVGMSRLYVGAHLPLDIIGGAGLGVLCGLATSLAVGVPVDGVPGVAATETAGNQPPPREILDGAAAHTSGPTPG